MKELNWLIVIIWININIQHELFFAGVKRIIKICSRLDFHGLIIYIFNRERSRRFYIKLKTLKTYS
jgi:hypothetical protein